MAEQCIRCDNAYACDGHGMCGHCHWAHKSEVEFGLTKLWTYLKRWSEFRAWEQAHE